MSKIVETVASATYENNKISVTLSWSAPTTIAEAVEMYGEEKVLEYFEAQGTRNLQNNGRSRITAGKTPEAINTELAGWNPNTAPQRMPADPVAKLTKGIGALSEDQKSLLFAQLKALISKKG